MKISKITLGTVNFGMNYGIRKKSINKISIREANKIINIAIENGINCFDTSPNYGNSESILGSALKFKPDCIIATKIQIPNRSKKFFKINNQSIKLIKDSIEKSRKSLQRDKIDILQIHNASLQMFKNKKIMNFLMLCKEKKKITKIGASVYSEKEALCAIKSGWIDVIQVAYNLFDQQMSNKVFVEAKRAGVLVFTRSTFLKGVLTEKVLLLPKELKYLINKANKTAKLFKITLKELPQVALRFCLSNPKINSVIAGFENSRELKRSIKALNEGPLKKSQKFLAQNLSCGRSKLVDPRNWPFV